MLCTPSVTPDAPAVSTSRREAATALRKAMQHVMARTNRVNRGRERRRERRTPFPQLFKIAPTDPQCGTLQGEPIVVVGKHLSPGGIDFYHCEPLPFRWVTAWLEGDGGQRHAVLVELLWCRFNKHGWYENGGRFVRLLGETAMVA